MRSLRLPGTSGAAGVVGFFTVGLTALSVRDYVTPTNETGVSFDHPASPAMTRRGHHAAAVRKLRRSEESGKRTEEEAVDRSTQSLVRCRVSTLHCATLLALFVVVP